MRKANDYTRIPALLTRHEHNTILEYVERKHKVLHGERTLYFAMAAFVFGLASGVALMAYGLWLLQHANS